jgi:hypothetical protein
MGAKSEQPEQRLLRSFVSAPAQAGERGGSELQLVQPHLPPLQGEASRLVELVCEECEARLDARALGWPG